MYVLGWDDCNLFQATNLFPGCLCAPFFVKFTLFFCETWGSCTYYVITDRGGSLQTITVLHREGSWVPHTYFEKWFFRKPFRLIPWLLKRALHLVCASYHVYIAVEVTLNMSKQPAWQFGEKNFCENFSGEIFGWKFFGWKFGVRGWRVEGPDRRDGVDQGRYPPSDLECLSRQDYENIAHC